VPPVPARISDGPFDAAYYQRFYGDVRTRVQGPPEVARMCRGILEVARWWQIPVASVVEIGAGTGLARDWFAKRKPDVRYVSTDVSPFACKAYGHRRLDIGKTKLRGRFDLVVCQGVLPYLDDAAAARALDHIGAMAAGLLYLECQTNRDIADVVDATVSDSALRGRPAHFYLAGLEAHFVMLGGGLWIARRARVPLYELESGTLVRNVERPRARTEVE
jgi:SAM-dependent methyltransferase